MNCAYFNNFSQVVKSISKVFPKDNEASPGGVDDMTKLSDLHEPGVLHNLAARYGIRLIYKRISLCKVAQGILWR